MILLSLAAHGVTGTWLDEIVEIGLPLVLFIALYVWSSRKEKKARRQKPPEPKAGAK